MDRAPNGFWDLIAGNDTSATFWEMQVDQKKKKKLEQKAANSLFLAAISFYQIHSSSKISKWVTIPLFIKMLPLYIIIPTHKKIHTNRFRKVSIVFSKPSFYTDGYKIVGDSALHFK